MPCTSWAQADMPATDTSNLSELSLDQLNKLKSKYSASDLEKAIGQAIEAASINPVSLRKNTSIISVITKDEILKSGATTLMDVLKLVPGIEFNVDVTGVVALSFRGIWANEGNLLLIIDGQEFNETAYNSLQFGNHYPVHQIKRIEIIRGPGSAIYGGAAELAVINIITEKGNDLKGFEANITDGVATGGYTTQNINMALGNGGKNYSYSVAGLLGRAQTPGQTYTDVYGNGFSTTGNTGTATQYLNANFDYKNWSARIIYDNYSIDTRDGYVAALSRTYPCNFSTLATELKYNKHISRKVLLNANVNYKQSSPWENAGLIDAVDSHNYSYYKITVERLKANLNAVVNFSKWLKGTIGAESIYDYGKKYNGEIFHYDSSDHVSYFNYAPFAQVTIIAPFSSITIGGRYDYSNAFGSSFSPRIGITKKIGRANYKLQYASSFRAPSIENVQYAIDRIKLLPETSNTLEGEASFKLNKNMYLAVNIFDITTHNAIKYYVKTDSVINGDPDGYRNSKTTTGSQGFELEYKYKGALGFLNASFSYYTITHKGADSANFVALDKSVTLGTAQYKFSLLASINLGKHYFITPSAQFLGKRYGISSLDSAGNNVIQTFPAQIVLNVFAGSTAIKNITLGVGINNISNQNIFYIQAYNSKHAPLPGLGRNFYVSLKYHLSLAKSAPLKDE
jgi:outer membrane receptor for ferrienterochelin and colicin